MVRKWEIAPWSAEWASMYEAEAEALRAVFGDGLAGIHHIGSTAVEAIGWAKPIIDLLIVVRDIGCVDRLNEAMEARGYRARGENGIAGRRYFTKGDAPRTHHVHVFQEGADAVRAHLDFKAFLLALPAKAREYGQLKRRIMDTMPDHAYQTEKEARMRHLIAEASARGEAARTAERKASLPPSSGGGGGEPGSQPLS